MLTPLGLDIAKDKLDAALYQTPKYREATFPNTAKGYERLNRWLKKYKVEQAHVCLEATGRYGEGVATYLYEQGHDVSIVNPARIKAYAASRLQRNKTDRQDAKAIAHFCASQTPTLWTPPPLEIQELQALSRRLGTLKADRAREKNRLKAGLTSELVLANINAHITFLTEQIDAIKQQIHALFDRHPDLRQKRDLLSSIPGIGDLTSALFLAEVPHIAEFDSASQLAAYAGLTPRHHDSGSSVHRPARLAKTGNSRFRAALYMPALSAMRYNPIIRTFVARLKAKGKKGKTIVAAVMRKLVHLAFGILKHKRPFDPHYLVNVQVAA